MEPNRASAFLASKPEIGNDREKTTRVELPGNERDRKNRPGRLPIRRRIRPEWQEGAVAVPLLDMFPLATARPFHQIIVPPGYGVSYFQNYFTNNPSASPSGPDATDGDQ